MDIPAIKQMTPKKAVLFVLLLLATFVVGVVLWGVMGYQQESFGLSGTISQGAAPSMMSDSYGVDGGVRSAKMAYGGAGGVTAERAMMPPVPMPHNVPEAESKIIKNADLTMKVDDVDASVKKIEEIRRELGGQVGNISVSDYYSSRQGDITLWIPSEKFDTALDHIKGVAIRVTNEHISSTDVSAQFVDVEARLRVLHATEAQYVEFMKRTGTISEVLQVANQLSQTRQQIEQLQGQMNHLSRQVEMSSIHIVLTQEIASMVTKDEWRPLTVFKNSTRETLRGMTAFADQLIVFLVNIPLLLLKLAFWGGVIYVLWRVAHKCFAHLKALSAPTDGV